MSASMAPVHPATSNVETWAILSSLREERDAQQVQLTELQKAIDDLAGESDGDSQLEREMLERSIASGLYVIADVERALQRIADATYGLCERCHEAIPAARLEAIPYARHCVSCPPTSGVFD